MEICLIIFFFFWQTFKRPSLRTNLYQFLLGARRDGKAIKLERPVHLTVLRGSFSLFANWLLGSSCSSEAFLINVSEQDQARG